MRANPTRTGVRAGAFGLAMTGAALVTGAAAADNHESRLPLSLDDASVVVGQAVEASGRAGRDYAGRTVVLEQRTAGDPTWRAAASTTVTRTGAYRVRHRLQRAGSLRAVLQPPPGAATAAAGTRVSRHARVRVAPRVAVGGRDLHVRVGRRTAVRGRVSSRTQGVRVTLQMRRDGRWVRLDRARTSREGRFRVSDRIRSTVSGRRVRLAVAPHSGLSRARRGVGRLNVYRVAHASWYGPGFYGQRTGCGQTLRPGQLGTAHKSLPCGTRVTFRHRGRTVRVPVIDRGPYVAGRDYDLTEATAHRLRFEGHGPVLATK